MVKKYLMRIGKFDSLLFFCECHSPVVVERDCKKLDTNKAKGEGGSQIPPSHYSRLDSLWNSQEFDNRSQQRHLNDVVDK